MASTTQRGRSTGGRKQARTTQTERRESTSTRARQADTATVRLPFVTAEFRRPDVHMPQMRVPQVRIPSGEEVTDAVNTAYQTVRENLPPTDQMAYYGGLAALAALSVIEWPVAAAIGVGTVIAQRGLRPAGGRSGSSTAAA